MLRNDLKNLKSTLRVTSFNFVQQHTVYRNVALTSFLALFNRRLIDQGLTGWNMNKKVYFLSLSLLAMPGLAAAGYDLASPEYNLMANELNRDNSNQAAYISQKGNGNGTNAQQDGNHLLAVISQKGNDNQADVSQSGGYSLAYIDQAGSNNDADITQTGYGNTGIIIQRGSGNYASISQPSMGKTAIVVQNSSQMAVRVITR